MSEQHTHSHHHHHGGIDDYMKAVAEYRKTFPNKQDVIEQTPDPAVREMLLHMEEMGLETCGTHGTTACLAMLNDAVKKGGVMASSSVGGLSGAFIPVSEDAGMINAARSGALSIEKLEA